MIFLLSFGTEQDREKFEYLYNKYKNLLLHKAWGILKDTSLAEDAVSEAYLRVYKNLHKVDDPTSNRSVAFLVTIVQNVALTMLKKEKSNVAELFPEEKQDDFDLEQHILDGISAEHIHTILGGLKDELRHVFVLKFAHDLSHKEIAKTLNTTENNVTVRLHRAKKKIAELLVKEGYTNGSQG